MSTLASPSDLIGQVVDGRYRIRKILGRGGMGVVYEAEAIRLGKRPCAIKVLLPEYTSHETVRARFEREAEVAARVKHPNVVEIFDTGQTDTGLGYIAMELLVGESLDRLIKREGPQPWPRVQKLLLQICRALATAHAQGVIHRDVKPENCIRCTVEDNPDFIKVLDFGIAKLTDIDGDVEAARLTATNTVIGTYAYMAYEQICGEPIDHRVDIWAVGVILYELLTGRLPFRGTNQGQIWKAISHYEPEKMRDIVAGVPDGADAIVEQALAKDRDKRFQTIEAFARAVAGLSADGAPVKADAAKLAFPTIVPKDAAAIDVGAETALGDDDERPTKQVNPNSLTVLAPDDRKPITHETIHSVVAPSTHPGREAEPPPPREAMQTEIAPVLRASTSIVLHPLEPTAAPRSRRGRLILLALLTTAAAALLIYLSPILATTPADMLPAVSAPDTVLLGFEPMQPAPTKPNPEPAKTPPPKAEPPKTEPPTEPPKTEPASTEPTKVEIRKVEPKKPPDTKKVDPSREESFTDKVKAELRALRNTPDHKKCFADYQPYEELSVDVEVNAGTGAATVVTTNAIKRYTPLAGCLTAVYKQKAFSRGKPGDSNYRTVLVLNKQ